MIEVTIGLVAFIIILLMALEVMTQNPVDSDPDADEKAAMDKAAAEIVEHSKPAPLLWGDAQTITRQRAGSTEGEQA